MHWLRQMALTLAALILTGCGLLPQRSQPHPPVTPLPPSPSSPAPSSAAPSQAVAITRSGMVYPGPTVDLAIKGVERHPRLTALRMEMAVNGDDFQSPDFGYHTIQNYDFAKFWLVDPVNKKLYSTLRENDAAGNAFGTRHTNGAGAYSDSFRKGTRYPVEVYFPPLPPEAKTVTVLATDGLGELTGVPVTDGAPEPVAKARQEGDPEPGGRFQWEIVLPNGKVWSEAADIQEFIETEQKSTRQEGDTETIGLRTDVLFAFDKATLSDKAATILEEVAQETRAKADPAKPPIIIEGHTDSKGDDSYNETLSVKRAQAVQKYLAGELGSEYVYKTVGKGESEPIAKNEKQDGSDNPEGRARNRRVEISYKIKEKAADTTVTEPAATDVRGGVGEPAPLRNDLGPVAGSFTRGDLKVDVHPFYRDGAYLVGSFEVRNLDKNVFTVPVPQPFGGVFKLNEWVNNSAYAMFTVVDKATKARYYPVRINDSHFIENPLTTIPAAGTQRVYIYYPAPPDSVTSVLFEARDDSLALGKVDNVPIIK